MSYVITLLAVALLASAGSAQTMPCSLFEKLPVWAPSENAPVANPNRYVFRDASTDEIVISYPVDRALPNGARVTYRYRPQNQVAPKIRATVTRQSDGTYRYSYVISNGSGARQNIENWSLIGPGPASDILQEHPRWGQVRLNGSVVAQAALPGTPGGELLDWSSHVTPQGLAIRPGQSEPGFIVTSSYRPGFTTAYIQGGQPLSTNGDLPLEVADQLSPLMTMAENNRIVLTLGPRFSPEATRAEIATDYQNGLSELVKAGIIQQTSGFVARVETLLEACSVGETERCRTQKQALPGEATSGMETEITVALLLALQ